MFFGDQNGGRSRQPVQDVTYHEEDDGTWTVEIGLGKPGLCS